MPVPTASNQTTIGNAMRQGLDDELSAVLTDVLTLEKPDGRVFENIKAHVSDKGILIIDVSLPIEAGDKLIRVVPSGLRDVFVVDDPGYHAAVGGVLPAHFQAKVHRERSVTPVSHAAPPPCVLSGSDVPTKPEVTVPRVKWNLPPELSESARDKLFATRVQATEILKEQKSSVHNSEHAEALRLTFVLSLFVEFVQQGRSLCMQGVWTGERFESECLDFLLERAREADLARGSEIRPDVNTQIERRKEWKTYRQVLNQVTDARLERLVVARSGRDINFPPSDRTRTDDHRSTGRPLESYEFWTGCRAEFDILATRQRTALGQETRKEWLKAFWFAEWQVRPVSARRWIGRKFQEPLSSRRNKGGTRSRMPAERQTAGFLDLSSHPGFTQRSRPPSQGRIRWRRKRRLHSRCGGIVYRLLFTASGEERSAFRIQFCALNFCRVNSKKAANCRSDSNSLAR